MSEKNPKEKEKKKKEKKTAFNSSSSSERGLDTVQILPSGPKTDASVLHVSVQTLPAQCLESP